MKVITEKEFDAVVSSEKPVVVDFYADWCGPCRMLGPMLQSLSEELEEVADIVKFDFEANSQQVPDKHDVKVLPTLIIFKQGRELDRTEGVLPKPKLKAWIEETASS
tara:strand:- start:160 stop:480 length:321 start_codon:yes stop_codon:yes gene_type:complete